MDIVVRSLDADGVGAAGSGFAGLARLHPDEPHWYLALVGVDPGRQSRGVGSRLLHPVLDLADRVGVACYLETPFEGTIGF